MWIDCRAPARDEDPRWSGPEDQMDRSVNSCNTSLVLEVKYTRILDMGVSVTRVQSTISKTD